MTNREMNETMVEAMKDFPSIISERIFEKDANVTKYIAPGAYIEVYPTDFMVNTKAGDPMCAVKTARLHEVGIGKVRDGWYLFIYLKGADDDFFNVKIS